MYTTLKKVNEGFTIVETLIVLAIAALIITIILIAVPDLQRSSRNSNILHDAQNVASGVQTYEGNNSGAIPAGILVSGTAIATATPFSPASDGSFDFGATTGVANSTVHVQASDTLMYTSGAITTVGYTPNATLSSSKVGPGQILIDFKADCATNVATTSTNADPRAVAIIYPIESSTGSLSCIQE